MSPDTRFEQRLVREAFGYSVGHLPHKPEPRDWWRSDRHEGFYERLVTMTLAPTEGRDLNRALHVPRTLGRLVLARYAPPVECIDTAAHNETVAQAEADVYASLARKSQTVDNIERAYAANMVHLVMIQHFLHALAFRMGREDNGSNHRRSA